MIIGIEGGMRIAAEAAFDTIAADRARGYPRLPMAGMTTLPMAAASATEEPEISDWIMVATTVAMASPPRTKPTTLWARFTRRSEMPPVSMSPPARLKSGMASSGKLEAPGNRITPRRAAAAGEIHVVRPEETVSSIAKRYGLSVDDVLRWNSLESLDQIRPGDRLRVAELLR